MSNFLRIFKFGWREISRNFGISIGTIFVMFIVLSLLGGILLMNKITYNLVTSLEKKVDVSVYFKDDVKEEDILAVQKRIEKFPEVQDVEYVSREKALQIFKKTHKDNPILIESLNELGENPLPASLNIRAKDTLSYVKLANFLEKGDFSNLIEKTNWKESKTIIERLFSISRTIKKGGIIISFILAFIAVVVIFNTVRLSIFSRREEIETMKLIGATNWFVRGPFLIEGILIGVFGGILAFLLFFSVDSFLLPESLGFFGELGVLTFFEKNLLLLILIQIGGGILFGAFSSFIAAQRYLKV